MRQAFNRLKVPVIALYVVFLALWILLFTKESLIYNFAQVSKLMALLFIPGILFLYAFYPDKDPVLVSLIGFCIGPFVSSLLYFLLGLFGIGLKISIFTAPLIMVVVSVGMIMRSKSHR